MWKKRIYNHTVARRNFSYLTFSWGFDHPRRLWMDLWNQTGLHHQTSIHDPLCYSWSRILKARDHQSLCYCWLNRTWRRQLHHSLLSCWCMRFPGDILFDSPFDIPKPPLWFSSDACDFWEREREREHRKRRHAIFFPFWFEHDPIPTYHVYVPCLIWYFSFLLNHHLYTIIKGLYEE